MRRLAGRRSAAAVRFWLALSVLHPGSVLKVDGGIL